MKTQVLTVADYLTALPEERRAALESVREVVLANLDPAYEEGIQYGMIGYYVPHRIFPAGYHSDPKQPLPFAALASQKRHLAIYLSFVNGSEASERAFRASWARTGKKLDMGKSCIRFRTLEQLALDVIGTTIKQMPVQKFVEQYLATRAR